jgi:hypothetical protein
MSNSLLDVIKEIFSTYNYSVSAKSKDFDLIAEKPNNNVAIRVVDSPSADDVKQIAEAIRSDGGAKGLIVSVALFSEDARKVAKQKDVMIWDRPELERQIGKAVLMRLEGANDPFAAGAAGEAGPEPENKDVASLTRDLYAAPEERPKAKKPEPRQQVIEVEEEPAAVQAAEAPQSPEAPEPLKLPIKAIPIKIKSSDAVKISGNIGRAEDTEVSLNFIPFWKYDYSLDVIGKYRELTVPITGKGSRMINAINKNVDAAPASKPLDGVEIPDVPYNVQQAVLTEEEARTMAVKAIIEEHSKTVRFKGTQGEAAIVEHKKFSPKPADIRFSMEMLYVPFWAVRSHKGYMEINAYDGKPTQMPIDNGAEIL